MKRLIILLVPAMFLAGCCTSKKCQLEHIAKDWCMTIRASQVIPVYPLTEDLQPGDIFLVQVPIDRQQEVYKDKGFLPLDNHLARVNPHGYTNFYDHSFFAANGEAMLPFGWMRATSTNNHAWDSAPRAAFPSYSFSVRRGGGMNLAVPVQGVPVGLSMLGSDAASGSVTIRKVSTLGVDIISLHAQITNWALANSSFLSSFSPFGRETNYLRIVTRVYVTGEMDVELRDASSKSAGLDVGAAKPVNLLFPELPKGQTNVAAAVAQNYTNGWNVLSDLLQKATSATDKFAPGGSVRLMAASARTIALQETFDPPLMLGYLGFDCAILEKGRLGAPIPTHAQLDRKARLQHGRVVQFGSDLKQQIASYDAVAAVYRAQSAKQKQIREIARQLKFTASGEGEPWILNLGKLVNGNDPAMTERFNELQRQVNAL